MDSKSGSERPAGAVRAGWRWVFALVSLGCSDPVLPTVPAGDSGMLDGGPVDGAMSDDAQASDAGDGTTDAGPMGDAGTVDGGLSDAGSEAPAACAFDPGTDLMAIGLDSDAAQAPSIQSASSATDLAVVFTDDDDGTRRVRIARTSAASTEVVRGTLEGIPEGAVEPAIASVGAGWLVAYRVGAAISVQAFDAAFAPVGAANRLADVGAVPRVTAAAGGAYASYRSGTRWFGRALSTLGVPTAAAAELLPSRAAPEGAAHALGTFGQEGDVMAAISGTPTSPAVISARLVGATAGLSPTLIDFSASAEASGSLALAGPTPEAPPTTFPLLGAAVWENVDTGFRRVQFGLIGPAVTPEFAEFTASEPGIAAWGAGIAPLRTGYLLAYREERPEGGRIRLASLGRESCRFGGVDGRQTLTATRPRQTGPVTLSTAGTVLLAGWAEVAPTAIEYRVLRARCE